ncbi:ATP-binding protein [Cesiribacter sp. SM1]|uniref:ATP-binding protein n=1 Tax=Cesiribacter sp. SM1 TaxID=2861196 RepID=UPI001CD53F07|nr:ATP-binding protein [Cesiribacter sp. SM1]
MYTVKDLLTDINPVKRTFYNYSAVFGIKLGDYMIGNPRFFSHNQKIDEVLYDYFIKNKRFVDEFYEDWHSSRTMSEIAEKHKLDVSQVIELFKENRIFTNFRYKGETFKEDTRFFYFSTYQVIELLTGRQVIERPEALNSTEDHQPPLEEDPNSSDDSLIKIIGYDDIKSFIIDELAPITNPQDIEDWGINNPGGILLYGPPGCGKTLWANWIADFLKYDFIEIPRSMFGSTYVDGAMNNLKGLLDDLKSKQKVVVFFDEFDSIASSRTSSTNSSGSENAKVVNTLLQEIPKLISKQIVLVAATNFIDTLDPAVIRPGRFDLKLPIFPPLPVERLNLLYGALTSDSKLNPLNPQSPLLEILKYNDMLNKENWAQFSGQLILFSNSQIIDLANIIKRKIWQKYKMSNFSRSIEVTKELIEPSINEAKAKLTNKDTETLKKFLSDCRSSQLDIFNERINSLENELEPNGQFNKNPIGFTSGKKK